ncbi:MAG TPA: c-type cytochrome [Polyangiales bacterium]|nr:c-type cytochrome [Polyangiales bacterium]
MTWWLAVCGLALLGCSQPSAQQPAAQPVSTTQVQPPLAAATPPADPKHVFETRCATCHGATGHGDGPASSALNPKPRNYTDLAWQKSVTDEQIKQTILYGGAAVGKSPVMPASPDLESQPVLLDGLIKIVRGFGAG